MGQGTGQRRQRKSRESTFLQGSPQVRAPARRRAMSVWHQASPDERRCDLELAGVVLDRLGARCADRPGLTALSRVLGDDASAAPASSPAPRGALEQLQRKPHRAGIAGGSRGWFRTGHGREQYDEPINRDTVTVRCFRSGILYHVPRTSSRPTVVEFAAEPVGLWRNSPEIQSAMTTPFSLTHSIRRTQFAAPMMRFCQGGSGGRDDGMALPLPSIPEAETLPCSPLPVRTMTGSGGVFTSMVDSVSGGWPMLGR